MIFLVGYAWQLGNARSIAYAADGPRSKLTPTPEHTHNDPLPGATTPILTQGVETDVEGIVTVVWGDARDGTGAPPVFTLHEDSGTRRNLQFQPGVLTRDTISSA